MESKKINQLATNVAPVSSDLTIIGDPTTGVSKKVTLLQIANLFAGAVDFYANLAAFPATGVINTIYCAKDTQKLYLWSGSAYVETFPSQAVLNTYQLLSAKGVANGYASLDASGKVPIGELPSSIMEYKGLWSAATNTPTLANGTGDTGDVYICSAAGTVNFGAGGITFAVGDYVIYSGTIWQRSSGAVGTVTSVGLSSATSGVTIGSTPVTTSGTITLAIATATTSQNGLLSSTDWATFNAKANDSLVVHLAGTETITGIKTFSNSIKTTGVQPILIDGDGGTNNGGIAIRHATTQNLSGSNYTNINAYGTTGLLVNHGIASFQNKTYIIQASGLTDETTRTYTLPDASGTLALVGGAGVGTVTSVAALTLGTTGTDLSSTVANGTTTPVITLNVPTASATNRGALTSADWTTFNNKLSTATAASTYVPYTGATANVDLGTYDLSADIVNVNDIKALSSAGLDIYSNSGTHIALMGAGGGAGTTFYGGIVGTSGSFVSSGGSDTFAINHSSGSGIALNITKGGNNEGLYINKTSGSGNAATIIGTLNATTLVKSGGTSSQFLKADGSVDSSTYITLASLSASSPLSYNNTTGAFSIQVANTSQDGYLSSTDWNTFNGKQNTITNPVTGTGTSGQVTYFNSTSSVTSSSSFKFDGTNLTIGNPSSALAQLHVYNASAAATILLQTDSTTDYSEIAVRNNSSTATSYFRQYSTAATGSDFGISRAGLALFFSNYATNFAIGTRNGGSLIFGTADTERARIDASGNLGLGVTPSAWFSSIKSFQIGTGAALWGGSLYTGLSSNYFVNTSGTDIYIANGFASSYLQVSGGHQWYNAASGTAGNAITFTQAMTLTAAGNVGIGTSSPTELLHINSSTTGAFIRFQSTTGSGVYLGGRDNNMELYAGGSERMRITSDGDLLIGDTTASANLWVKNSGPGNLLAGRNTNASFGATVGFFGADRNTTNNSFFYIDCYNYGSGTYRFRVADSGNVTNTNNSYGAISDIKLKENITNATPKLDDLLKVQIRNFNYIGSDEKQIGVIAQELIQVFPSMVDETNDKDANGKDLGTTTKSVKYSVFVPMLIKAIQEQQQQIEELKLKIK